MSSGPQPSRPPLRAVGQDAGEIVAARAYGASNPRRGPRAAPRVCVLGLGYVGLPLAVVMASAGLQVVGVDIQPHVVEAVNAGRAPLAESGLDERLRGALSEGALKAVGEPVEAEIYVIAVPTPITPDRTPDLRHVEAAVDSIAARLRAAALVVIESTCPVHTTERICERLARLRPDLHFSGRGDTRVDQVCIAYCPERMLPGNALDELQGNTRIVGGLDALATQRAAEFYSRFVYARVVTTTARTAELCKLVENTYRDVNIALANEVAALSRSVDVDPFELIRLANLHPRVDLLQPGPGVGGHCISVDPWFLVDLDRASTPLIHAARTVNDQQPARVAEAVKQACAGLEAPVIAAFGLTYKPDVDDVRESPAMRVVALLAEKRLGTVVAVDPFVSALPASLEALGVELLTTGHALERADVLVLLVHHRCFVALDKKLFEGKRVVDTRGVW